MLRLSACILLVLCLPFTLFALSDWAQSYGLKHASLPDSLYIVGFAMDKSSDAQALERAKETALNDLVQKISVKIRSEQIIRESGYTDSSQTAYNMVISSSSSISMAGVEYLVERGRGNLYVLAHVRRKVLADYHAIQAKDALVGMIRAASQAENAGSSLTRLYDAVVSIPALTGQFEEAAMHIRLISGTPAIWNRVSVEGCTSEAEYSALKKDLANHLARTGGDKAKNFDEAVEKIAVALKTQQVPGSNIEGGPLSYGETALSSQFGAIAGEKIRAKLASWLSDQWGSVRIKGSYREAGNQILLTITALSGGKRIAAAMVSFPTAALKNQYELKPRNYDEAVLALREFSEGAIVDGGLNVELWTQKGRDADTLIFEEDEEFQLYLRVNQPAFLRITYILSTGECILLEPLYYVSMNKVNRAIKYPDVFEVVPPLGVEQLVVTAFSNEPGQALTELKKISGQVYEVYKGMAAVTAKSRGLRKKQQNGQTMERVGETLLSLTTVKGQKGY